MNLKHHLLQIYHLRQASGDFTINSYFYRGTSYSIDFGSSASIMFQSQKWSILTYPEEDASYSIVVTALVTGMKIPGSFRGVR